MDKIELLGGACFSHGPYTFYKAVRISNSRVLRLGSFFLTKLWSDADLVSIGELQLLWIDSRGPNTPLASLRLYFLPENTPDGRRDTHGEDEVLTISEKVVVRVHDLVTWLSPSLEWSCGREVSYPSSPSSSPDSSPQPQTLSDPGLDFSDVERHQKDLESSSATTRRGELPAQCQTKVVVLSYARYCRYRALLRRLEGSEPRWLCSSIAAALGGFTAVPGTRVLFCRDTFDYPDLETHELLCNHLAPKLKGRPRRKRKKRSVSPGESSNESEASVASSAAASTSKGSTSSSGQSSSAILPTGPAPVGRPPGSGAARRSERKISAEEKKFVSDVQSFMTSRNTPLGKMPLLGYRQIDLFLFYTKVQDLGGYDKVSANRLWKSIYDEMGGNTGSTSAATITRRHYERLLLPYERCQKGDDSKVNLKPNQGAGRRIKTPSISDVSEDSVEVKRETESPPPTTETPTSTTNTPPPLQSILSTSAFLLGEKPRTESSSGKTSSLRSVRVKPERLKSLNSMIASQPASQQQLPPSSPTSLTMSSGSSVVTPLSTASSPSGSPTATSTPINPDHSVLERQLNSPLITQQVPPSCSPPGLPVSTVATNATTVVTLTPPPEKDMKEIKLDPKQTSLLAQGKENIPLFEEKGAMFGEKTIAPHSPEVIDLETENESGTRDKLIIPSFKKRKLEILREGGLEVTPVDLETRPSVIQPTTTTTTSTTGASPQAAPTPALNESFNSTASSIVSGMLNTTPDHEEDSTMSSTFNITPTTVIPKLINVTVTPDISHMLPHEDGSRQQYPTTPIKQPQSSQHSNGPSTSPVNSRVINLGNNSNNSALLQLYANANIAAPQSLLQNQRFGPPQVSNGRLFIQPGVTQSKSMFDSSEKMVYGNPKDILAQPKYVPSIVTQPHTPRTPSVQAPSMRCGSSSSNEPTPGAAVVDLSQKATPTIERASYGRPNLEIVKVPVVPRPTPLNLETRNHSEARNLESPYRSVIGMTGNVNSSKSSPSPHHHQQQQQQQQQQPMSEGASTPRKNHFVTGSIQSSPGAGYANVLDSRTMATNNLEITLVSPRKTSGGGVGGPQLSPTPTNRNNHTIPSPQQRRHQHSPHRQHTPPHQQHHLNGKFPTRMPPEPVSPYTPRKAPSSSSNHHHPVIPNVPNLSHLNANAVSGYGKSSQITNYQQMAIEKRKAAAEAASNEQRRISEGDKVSLQQQQQQRLESKQARESETSSRRHSMPNVPTGYIPAIPPTRPPPGFYPHQLAGNSNNSQLAAAAAAAAASSKYLPILDPMYYSAFYNGLFPGPIPPPVAAAAAAGHLMSPELQAYYKELLASSSAQQQQQQQAILAMAASQQHQPAAPTSK